MKRVTDTAINPVTGNHYWFDYMINNRWTIKAIRNTFCGSRAIAEHIQSTARNQKDAVAIANAHYELTNQTGF